MSLGSRMPGRLLTCCTLLLLPGVTRRRAAGRGHRTDRGGNAKGDSGSARRRADCTLVPARSTGSTAGFIKTSRDWSPRPDDSKFLVYQSRMTWTAAAYAEFDKARREEFLGYARHGLTCLDTVCATGSRGLPLDCWPRRECRCTARRREARLRDLVRDLRGQQAAGRGG